jgi:signal transduction histidine kinase
VCTLPAVADRGATAAAGSRYAELVPSRSPPPQHSAQVVEPAGEVPDTRPAHDPAPSPSDSTSPATFVLWACDVVFGSIMTGLALLTTALWVAGEARPLTVALFWTIPAFNLVWTAVSRERDLLRSELLRNLVSLPIATYLYVADAGMLHRMWLPSLTMSIGFALQQGVTAPSRIGPHLVTLAYAAALFAVATLAQGSWDLTALNHAVGIVLTGVVLSLVASGLGRSLAEAQRQRDRARMETGRAEQALELLTQRSSELSAALGSLRTEMAHRLRMETELNQLHKLEAVGRLASGVAHEINTPVQFVSDSIQFVRQAMPDLLAVVDKLVVVQRSVLDGQVSLVAAVAADAAAVIDETNLPYLTEQLPIALDRALTGLARVTVIVRSLREFAHPDSMDLAAADLNQAIQSTLTIASNEWKYVADVETHFGELPIVRCFVGELNQAVLNIIVNAGHAIADATDGTAKGRIRVETLRSGDDVVISIGDTGGGIPEPARARIFDPFFTTKEVGRGTGQGLAIARSVIVDKHHGQLTFETEVGKGTTFFIRLPIDGPG